MLIKEIDNDCQSLYGDFIRFRVEVYPFINYSRGHVAFFRQLGDGLTRMIEGDKGFSKFF